MAGKHALFVPTRSITFGVPVLDDFTGKPLEQTVKHQGRDRKIIAHENITVTPDAAAWIPDHLVDEFKAKGFIVAYDETIHSHLPVPVEPEDQGDDIELQPDTAPRSTTDQPDPTLARPQAPGRKTSASAAVDPLA